MMNNRSIQNKLLALVMFTGLSLVLMAVTSQSPWRAFAQDRDDHVHDEEEAVLTHEDDEGHDEVDPHEEEDAHAGHNHGAQSFGVVTLEHLMGEFCEHEMATVLCDECRYEVGVAHMDPNLSSALLATAQVGTLSVNDQILKVNGQVQLDLTRVADLTVAGAGRVDKLHGILGDSVVAGETLATVQSAQLGRAQGDYMTAEAQLALAMQTHERETQLRKQSVTSEADFQQAQLALRAAQATVAATQKQLALYGVTDESNMVFGELAVRSPIQGTVIDQTCVQGQWAEPSDTLYRVADLSRLWVFCDVYESDLGALIERYASGQAVGATITSKAFAASTFPGTLDMIGSQLDEHTRTVKCRVLVDNAQGRLKPGMFVQVTLGLGQHASMLTVPQTAVLSDEGQAFVFVPLGQDLWIRRDVDVGAVRQGQVQILQGLSQGETLVTRGAFMFKSEILKEKMGAGCAH
ncbi:MAG: efflux RND transporter periplasmic adaptor subunit [Planctomycetes bacterium]|nr:efflux RND transporter periplasmic adaptor subunit [Planctomycetota bacterium]